MPPPDDDCSGFPSLDGLVAATMALMTTWAAPCPQARLSPEAQRPLLARKVVSNLFFLQHHPQASEALRQVVSQVHARWADIAREDAPAPGQAIVSQAAPGLH